MPLDQVDVDKLEVDQNGQTEHEMSFLEHLEELRWHLIRSVSSIMIFATAAFLGGSSFFQFVFLSPKEPDFITYRLISKLVPAFVPPEFNLETRVFAEQFIVHIKASFLIGLVLSVPYILWEIWRFIKPGLYNKERKAAKGFVLVCSVLFLLGVSFGYFIIAPFAIKFLAGYSIGAINAPTLDSYVNYMVLFTLPTGLVFELPVVVYFLAKIGLIDAAFMRTYRRHAIITILIVSAMITPPDVFTQVLIAIPIFILYELSIGVAKRVEAYEEEEEDREKRAVMKK